MKHTILLTVVILLFIVSAGWAQDNNDDTGITDKPEVRTIVKTKVIVAKDPTLAGLLSAQFPGVGQMYCRKWLKGGIFLLGTAALYGTANEFSTRANADTLTQDERDKNAAVAAGFFIGGLAVHVWNVIDAIKTAERYNKQKIDQHTVRDKLFFDVKLGFDRASIGLAKRI